MGKMKNRRDDKISLRRHESSWIMGDTRPKSDNGPTGEDFHRRILEAKANGNREEMAAGYFGLVFRLLDKDDFDKALLFLDEARVEFGEYLDSFFMEMNLYYRKNDHEKSLMAGERYLETRRNSDPLRNLHLIPPTE